MKEILLFILLGLGPGALIAGSRLGVLTYRGAGVINLATGGMAMLAGYAFWALRSDRIAGHAVVDRAGPRGRPGFHPVVGVAVELIAFRPLRTASPLAKLVSSLGVLLIAQAAVVLAFGTTPQNEPGVLPQTPV